MTISGSGVSSYAYTGVSGPGVSSAGVSDLLPSLDLNFISSDVLDSRITFTRGSQATLFDSAGTLRYAKHNLLLQSQTFDNASWTKTNGTISADATTAPDGTTSADKFIPNNGISGANVGGQAISFVGGIAYTLSIFAKAAEFTSITILMTTGVAGFGGGNNAAATFDLSNGTVSQVERAGTAASIQDAGNGWYRLLLTATPTLAHNFAPQVARYNPAGDGTSGVFLWGGQLNIANMEGGVTSSLTTYYPTTTAAYYGPRFDYNPSTLAARGLLIEEARTNSIRNNTMQGAVAGTPGTLPTNWQQNSGTVAVNVVGTGTENGITYIDLQFVGTPNQTFANVRFETNTQIVAANAQTWSSSFYVRQIAGATTNITDIDNRIQFRDVGGISVQENAVSILSILSNTTINVSRSTVAATGANASIARITNTVYFTTTIGAAIDITLRIGLPQLELGAFATSVIPTTTTALTRNADVASMTGTNFSSWYNAVEGTLFANWTSFIPNGTAGALTYSAGFSDNPASTGAAQLVIQNRAVNNQIRVWQSVTGGGLDESIILTTTTFQGKAAAVYGGAANVTASANGGAAVTMVNPIQTTVFNALTIGSASGTGGILNGHIQRISYYPVRLSNVQLQALTS